ncbi:glutathione S-transferase family protein [Pelagibacterium luteolum]|uniref:Glutathione S-transferase n=1 Tax=Pelagibacterium luteolum TaxID=440168 RepID=A0A1G8ABG7_9HYPH|nr:glutathione S-transferase family protein [Pelagibacterium luteolum]SDH18229.1 Glutathione S-transferase [Pelagibacterium luteolum]
MKLLWSPRSPFVRKVMILLHELDQVQSVELIRAVATPRGVPNPEIMAHNPLGRIPVLLVPDGEPILDSALICEFLARHFAGGDALVPSSGPVRRTQMRWQALGDGLTENLLLYRIEKTGASGGDPERLASLGAKIRACFSALAKSADKLERAPFGIGQIAVICALGQADFRFPDSGWRAGYPGLATWERQVAGRPSVKATGVKDDLAETGPSMDLKI